MVIELLRYTVFGAFVLATAAAVGSWAVRTRRINPFAKSAQLIRKATDPVLTPIEQWLLRRGGNPQNAEWWLLGGVVGGGIITITLATWLARQAGLLAAAASTGPYGLIRLGVFWAGNLVSLALIVRVIGSWLGAGRHSSFMRPAYWLTDWIVEPLRKVIPPLGMIDLSPFVAYFAIQLLVALLTRG